MLLSYNRYKHFRYILIQQIIIIIKIDMRKINKIILEEINKESINIMMLSLETLKKDWDNKYDERWNRY